MIEDLFYSFSNHYDVPESKILNTLKDVFYSYTQEGRVILIGRGAVFITPKIDNALHLKLQAPLKWRVEQIKSKFRLSEKDAIAQCNLIDKKRSKWNNELSKSAKSDAIYDIILNTCTLTSKQMLDIIFTALRAKKIIPNT